MTHRYVVKGKSGKVYYTGDTFQECHRWINESHSGFRKSVLERRVLKEQVLPEAMRICRKYVD